MWWKARNNKKTADTPNTSAQPATPALIQALEPRMMFDGAVAATVVDAAADHNTDSQPDSNDVAAPSAAGEQRQEVVFIDSNVQNYQQLVDGIVDGVEVVVLNGSQDGLQQIADYLDGRSGIDSIHILSHGDSGKVQLGSTWLDAAGISTHQALLNEIGAALSESGDILLYGCKVGAESSFLEQLATATGADVAGSSDNTGNAGLDGNWTLEASTGVIEASQLDAAQTFAAYNALLAAPSSENFDGVALSGGYSFGVQGQARLLNGWTFSVQTNSGTVDSNSYVDITNQTGDTSLANDGSDAAALLNGGFNTGTAAVLKSTSGDAFSFQSIRVENGFSGGNDYRLVGYLDGIAVSGATINFSAGNYGSGGALVSASGAAWQQVDEVRIVRQTGVADVSIYIDDIVVAPAVAPNAAPTASATGNNPTFVEQTSAADLFSGVTANTNDSGQTFSGAVFTVSNVTNGASESLTISGTSINLSNSNSGALSGGGNYSVSVAGSTATVTLSGLARSDAQMATLIDGMTYANSSDDPGSATRTVTLTSVTDSGSSNNTSSLSLSSSVSVVPVNDAPTLSATGTSPNYTENASAVDLFSGVNISTIESGQSITGLTLTVSNLSDGASELLSIAGSEISLTDGTSGTTAGISYSVSVSAGVATLTLNTSGISTAVANSVIDGLAYRNSSDTPTAGNRTVTLTSISDNGGLANGGSDTASLSISSTVAVVPTNDTPAIAGLNGDSLAWPGVGNTVTLDVGSNAALSDAELSALDNWAGATLVLQRQSGAVSSDIFGFDTAGSALFTVSGNALQSGGQTFATFSQSGGALTITFNSTETNATNVLVNDVVRHLTYRNDTPAGDATIRVTLTDDGAAVATADISVTSDTIYVTNTTDTAVIDPSNGVSLSEAIAIAAADTTGTQTLVFDSSFAGQNISINAATLTESLTFDLGQASGASFSGGAITLNSGATLTIQNDAGDTVTFNNAIDGNGNLTKTGAGTLTLAGGNSYSGTTALSGGALQIATDSNLGAGSVTLSDATTLEVSGSTTIDNALVLVGTANVMLSNPTTFSGDISGSGNLVKQGSGNLTLSGANSYSGTTTVSAGFLLIAGDSNLGSGTLTIENSAGLTITGSGTIDNAIVLSGTFGIINTTTGVNATLSGIISGTGRLTKGSTGELTLSGSNTYSGGTYVSNSTLGITGNNSLGSGQLTLMNSAVLNISGGSLITNNIVINSPPTTINTSVDVTISGVISGSSTLTKSGTGTLTLTGNNTYSNNTIIQAGALSITNGDNISSGFIAIQNAGRLIVSSSTTLSNNVMLLSANSSVSVGSGDSLTLSGVVSGTGSLIKADSGTLILSGSNTYSGATVINGGTLSIAGDGNLGTGNLQLQDGTLRVTGAGTIDNAIVLGNGLFVNTIETTNDTTLSGVISGSGDVIKTGSGALTLSASNSATGTLTASAGTVLIDGSYDGQVSAQSTGTVRGNGTLNGLVAIFSGGTLAAGSSPGSLTINGNLQLETGSTLAVDISGTTAGTEYDQLTVNGTVTINNALLTVNLGSYSPPFSSSFTIISNDGADAISGTFSGLAEGSTVGGTTLSLSYAGADGNDFTLNAPASAAPVISNLSGDSVSYVEGSGAVRLDAGSNATVTDSDSPDFDGGTLTVAITGNRVSSEDILGIVNEGTGAGQIGVSGSNITYAGTIIGTFVGGTGTSDLVITLNANANAAATQALVSALTYSNGNNSEPATATRTVSVTLTDGDGATSSQQDISVSVVAVNDAPTLTATGTNPSYTENNAAVMLFSGASINTVEAAQSISSLRMTISNLANGASELLTIDGSEISLTDGNTGTTAGNGLTYSVSLSGSTATLTLSSVAGVSAANAETIVNGIGYRNASDAPSGANRTVTLTAISDNGGSANSGIDSSLLAVTSTVTLIASNDAPVITAPTSINVTEDIAGALTGISFSDADADAGSASVTATFGVASGSLSAVSGNGVTVGGNASSLTLSGSIADINAFISAGQLSFTTAANATADVALSISIDDGGNTGGPAESDSASLTLSVTAVNDAPVNSVPGTQSVDQDGSLAFSAANGNLISVSDVDSGNDNIVVRIDVTNGTFTVPGFGPFPAAQFSFSQTDINALLAGLVYTPTPGYNGPATLTITTTDTGFSGSGGAQTDIDTITINVEPLNPIITSTGSSSADDTYKVGDTLTLTVTFDQTVTVDTLGGTPTLLLETGSTDRAATYVSGSGSNTLTFSYTVQAGDLTADLNYQSSSALSLNGATIKSAASDDAVLTLPATGSADSIASQHALVIDGVSPTANIVVADTALAAGETSTVTITFSEAVVGVDLADFTVANGTLSNLATSDNVIYTATLTPAADTQDTSNLITLDNSGYLDTAGNTGAAPVNSNNFAIDTLRPTASITVADAALAAGETSTVTITFNEAVSGLTTANFSVENGALSNLTSGDGGITWTATLTPSGNIEDASNLVTLDNTGVQDAAGNTGTGTTASNTYTIDTLRPTASITVADTALAAGETSTVTITFNEAVSGLTTADLSVENGALNNLTSSDGGITWTATLTPTADVEDTGNLVTLDNTGVVDAAGNAGVGTTDSNNYAVDTLRPTATIVVADTALAAGENSTVTITFNEAVSGLTTADFSVENGALSNLTSGDGGVTWTATLTPTADVEDTGNLVTLDNTGVVDAAGNAGVGTTDSNNYAVDTLRPTATIVVADTALAAGENSTVTITFNEAVSGLTTADFSVENGALSNLTSGDGGVTWTATLTPTADVEDTSNLVTLDNTGVVDAAGNAGAGTTDSSNYAVDTLRPTASIVVADTALAAGETSSVTITFNEAVSGLGVTDFSVTNGALSNLTSSDGGVTWTATLTPTADVEDTSNLVTLDNTGVQDAAGNTGVGTTDSNNYAVDTLRPTASIVVADTALAAGESSTVTITFNEAVSGLDVADCSVANGTLGNLSSSDGGITWTATLTPTANVEDTSNLVTLDNTGVQDIAGNTGTGTTDSNNYAVDTLRPTTSIVVADTALAAGETTTVTITFSEAVNGLDVADFTVANGTLSDLTSSDGGITWTATLTPDSNTEAGSNVISLNNTGYTDGAGNTGTGTADSGNYAVDTLRPTASINIDDTALAAGETAAVNITFSEAVTGLDVTDFTVANGTLSDLTSSDGGITWTATLTPDSDTEAGSNVISLNNTGYTDAAGNTGTGTTNSGNYSIDTLRPNASINIDDTSLRAGETATVTITFSEVVSDLDVADFSVANGSLSGLTTNDGGITWTATLTPDAGVESTSNLITLNNSGYTDAAGNNGTGTTNSANYSIDTLRPTASINIDDTALRAGETTTVTVTFSEAVLGLDIADFTVANGALSDLTTSDGGITWTATLTPDSDTEAGSNVISLNNTGYTDAARNTGTGTTDSGSYSIDTERPTASIDLDDTALRAGETATVTVTFSEAVTGLDVADFAVANGILSDLTSSDGGLTWTATLTPTANVESASNLIYLDNTGYTDGVGNTGTGTTDSGSYGIDTVRPSASIAVDDTALRAGETATVTVTFTEAVLGLDIADFAVANGILSDLTSSDGGLTWTATLTPTANVESASNLITLNNSGYTDIAGNSGTGTTNSGNYAIDTVRPTASINIDDSALSVGETATVTINFTEAVTGLAVTDFTVANGTLSGLTSSDGGITWTATLTPSAGTEDSTNIITLNNIGYTDAAGNTGAGSTDSANYSVDTLRPTASINIDDTALAAGETATVTISFSEAVTGLDIAGFTVANGTLSDLISSDGGITWTATLTPSAGTEDSTNIITLNNIGYTDAAGNTGAGSTDSANYSVDTLRPTASINIDDTALAAGETATVTISFSEAVTGLDIAGFTVANGTLSDLISSDGGITWTATLTPTANIESASNAITLNNTGYTDAAGNTGAGSTNSANYSIDTIRPTASIAIDDSALNVGETATVTITFSEAVTGLDIADFTVANGILSDLTSSDGGITWTATLTPTSNIEDSSNILTLDNTGYTDAAGNTGTGTTDSGNYSIDTLPPTISDIALDGPSPTNANSVSFTVTFSEAVSGVDLGDFALVTTGNAVGNLSSLTQIDAQTWQVNVTDVTGLGSLGLAVNAAVSGITDSNGNAMVANISVPGYDIIAANYIPDPGTGTPDTPFIAPPPTAPQPPPSLLPPPTVGNGLSLNDPFINPTPMQISLFAQIFSSRSTNGFLGFGGGDAGVFDRSTLADLFKPGHSPFDILLERSGGAFSLQQQLRFFSAVETEKTHQLSSALKGMSNTTQQS